MASETWFLLEENMVRWLMLVIVCVLVAVLGTAWERRRRQRLSVALERRLAGTVRAALQRTLEDGREQLAIQTAAAAAELERRADALAAELLERSGELERDLCERQSVLGGRLQREAQSLAEGLAADVGRLAVPAEQCIAVDEAAVVRSANGLEAFITCLETAIGRVLGAAPQAIPERLPEPAGREWRDAWQTLEAFGRRDLPDLRRLVNGWSGAANGNGDGLAERLRRRLEPFDRPGRLGEVTLALQYLLEAFPVEQLSTEERAHLRRELRAAAQAASVDDDFHGLVAALAAAIGLDYRPVSYYRSRLDEARLAFVRAQVSPISLSERVGFAATAEPSVVVRLGRPFFFQAEDNVYYAGHAHVARD